MASPRTRSTRFRKRTARHTRGRDDPRRLAVLRRFPQPATEFAEFARTKLTFPVLSIGGEKANCAALADQVKLVANEASTVIIKHCGHWLVEEKPQETMDALIKFL